MNPDALTPTPTDVAAHRVEFFRLPPPRKRDPYFGLSRGWYYKAAAAGEIRMVAVRQIHAALGYYYDHRPALDTQMAESLAEADRLAAATVNSPLRVRVRARHAT